MEYEKPQVITYGEDAEPDCDREHNCGGSPSTIVHYCDHDCHDA